MARPDCDDGYYKIAYELGAALLSFGFGEIEGHILAVVLETQYGLGKRKSVELSPAKLSAEWEIPRQNVHRAIATLVARNVLLSLGGGEYVLVKDYQQWDKKGSTARVRLWHGFVSDAPSRAKAFKPLPAPKDRDDLIIEGMPGVNDGADAVIFKDDTQTAANESPSSSTMTTRHRQRLQTVIVNDDEQGVPPGPPIGEAHAELRMGEVEKKSVLTPATPEPPAEKPKLALFEAEHDILKGVDFEEGKHEPDRAELFRAACFIEAQFDGRSYALTSAMYRKARVYPNAWFIRALKKGCYMEQTTSKRVSSFSYFLPMLDDWARDGKPSPGPWDEYDDNMTLKDPEAHKARHKAERQAAWKTPPAVKPVPLPPEYKAPADWDKPGEPNPHSKYRRNESA